MHGMSENTTDNSIASTGIAQVRDAAVYQSIPGRLCPCERWNKSEQLVSSCIQLVGFECEGMVNKQYYKLMH
jgi:hypothetical protein